ncbi:hypothetical protein Pan97_42510 [Bremerella volcania]|uniref:DUF4412 domain-containing protein n=1 Tax=Bremerella volcania TaxID=2527984 RepID=A0A518CD81_9BACT|nr:hypothetical protein [Bremerella volcania]QDU77189.1 hypothetical protein Pan97_42510 [Bremerella volcania]
MKTASLSTAVLTAWASFVCVSAAADFEVTSQIFRGNARIPAVTYETVFKGAKVYDVVTTPPRQATIIDYDSGQITLLDPQRQVKLTLTIQDVLQHSAYFKSHANFPEGPLWTFLRNPKFEASYDPQTQVLKLAGDPLTYEADLNKIQNQPAVDDYARFCDWSSMLNFICAGGDLPQARIELNNQIRAKEAVPAEVRKTIRHADPTKSISLRSTHEYRWKLQEEDAKLIESIETDLAKAKAVSFDQYVKPAFSTAQK